MQHAQVYAVSKIRIQKQAKLRKTASDESQFFFKKIPASSRRVFAHYMQKRMLESYLKCQTQDNDGRMSSNNARLPEGKTGSRPK